MIANQNQINLDRNLGAPITPVNKVKPARVPCRFSPISRFSARINFPDADDSQLGNTAATVEGTDLGWLDSRWTLGTVEVFCPRCGLRIIFAPQNLDLAVCRCNSV
jgi:hypothetical protein